MNAFPSTCAISRLVSANDTLGNRSSIGATITIKRWLCLIGSGLISMAVLTAIVPEISASVGRRHSIKQQLQYYHLSWQQVLLMIVWFIVGTASIIHAQRLRLGGQVGTHTLWIAWLYVVIVLLYGVIDLV